MDIYLAFVRSDCVLDYVFVDEHNRHKRLKGMHAVRLEKLEIF